MFKSVQAKQIRELGVTVSAIAPLSYHGEIRNNHNSRDRRKRCDWFIQIARDRRKQSDWSPLAHGPCLSCY